MLQRPSLWKCLFYYILKISVPWKNWNFSCRFFEVCYNLLYAFKIPLNPKSENPRRKLAISVIQQTHLVSLLVIVGVCCNRTLQVRYQPMYLRIRWLQSRLRSRVTWPGQRRTLWWRVAEHVQGQEQPQTAHNRGHHIWLLFLRLYPSQSWIFCFRCSRISIF